ncbi:MAG: putative glycoside hydrolase [Thermomicrobiales bacterium]
MLFGQRHFAVRSRPYRRPTHHSWRMVVAAGVIAALGYGAYTVAGHSGASGAGQVGTFIVKDAYSGQPVAGAQLTLIPLACPDGACKPAETTAQGVVAREFSTNARGEIHARLLGARVAVVATQRDYDARQLELPWPPTEPATLALRPTWVTGRVTSLGKPLANVNVVAALPGKEPAASTTTDTDGRYRLVGVPDGASLIVDAPNISRTPHPVARQTTMDLALRPDVLTGVARDPQGQPIAGLTVAAGSSVGQTDANGAYRLEGVDDGASLIVKGVGYLPQTIPLGANLTQDVTLRPFVAKGVYMQAPLAADPAQLDRVMNLIATKDLNTIVVDLKDNNGVVYYDAKVPLAREVGAVQPILNVPQLLQTLHAHHIYAIARIVVMEDPIAATKRPDLAIKDARTGKVWRTTAGQPWLNPTNPAVWQYVSDLAAEAANLGFDEVQFDYVRFPSDGNLNVAEYGPAFNGGSQERRAAITGLLKMAHAKIAPTRALLGADIFGITAWQKDDNGIGQQFEEIAALVDVICTMDYPSHFSRGFNGWDIPNNYPYDVIRQSLIVREQRVPGVARKTRPWLQAFTYGPGIAYGTAQVYAQIQACNEMQSSGYLLWNVTSEYDPAWLPPKPTESA